MSYKHGVYAQEQPTSIVSPKRVDVSTPFVVGTAPVGGMETPPVNEPKLIYSYKEFVENFYYDDDFDNYTLCEFARVYFGLYGVGSVIFVNAHDPATQKESVTDEEKTFADNLITPAHEYILSTGRYKQTAA